MLDHGEDARGMSSEVLVLFCASSCVVSGLARGLKGNRVEVVVGPALELDLFSNSDLKDDTGFCQNHIQQSTCRYIVALLTMEASSVPSSVGFGMA